MKIDELAKEHSIVKGDFNDLSKFDFKGVYILYNSLDEVVYVGSAYARTISDRLSQYLRKKDSGNSLLHSICKSEYGVAKVKEITDSQRDDALKIIEMLKIKAIHHKDLEYQLIEESQPKYNKAGTDIDMTY